VAAFRKGRHGPATGFPSLEGKGSPYFLKKGGKKKKKKEKPAQETTKREFFPAGGKKGSGKRGEDLQAYIYLRKLKKASCRSPSEVEKQRAKILLNGKERKGRKEGRKGGIRPDPLSIKRHFYPARLSGHTTPISSWERKGGRRGGLHRVQVGGWSFCTLRFPGRPTKKGLVPATVYQKRWKRGRGGFSYLSQQKEKNQK